MSVLMMNLRRLLTARKAWRVFAAKVQSKLHKLNRSKAIKKHRKKNQLISTTPSPTSCKAASTPLWPFLAFQSRFRGKRQQRSGNVHPVIIKYKPRHRYQKKSAPVYIDELFIEPVLAQNQPLAAAAEKKSPSAKKGKLINIDQDDHQAAAAAGTSEGGGGRRSHAAAADDMWESLVLTSPQMHGINERAEEFISRFRAEMLGGGGGGSHL